MAQNQEFRHILRVINTDLDGNKPVLQALRKIKGVSFMFSNAVLTSAKVDKDKKAGYLEDAEIKRIEEVLRNPLGHKIPAWMLNRQNDYETGDDMHLMSADLTYQVDNDTKRLKKIRAYRGVRHMLGLPMRGQRTKSNFRKNKGKVQGIAKKKDKARK